MIHLIHFPPTFKIIFLLKIEVLKFIKKTYISTLVSGIILASEVVECKKSIFSSRSISIEDSLSELERISEILKLEVVELKVEFISAVFFFLFAMSSSCGF